MNLTDALLTPPRDGKSAVMGLMGKAGSGKTLLLAELVKALRSAGVDVVSGDYEGRKRKDRRTLAVAATNTGSNGNGKRLDKDGNYVGNHSPVHVFALPSDLT